MIRMLLLAEVAARTDDRNVVAEMVNEARDAYPTGSLRSVGERRTCSRWRRGSATTSMTRCAGCGDITLLVITALASGLRSGDLECAGGVSGRRCRPARACPAGHRGCWNASAPRCRCSRRSPSMPAGYSNVMPTRWWLPRTCFNRRRGRFFTPRQPRTPAAELARTERDAEALDQLNAAFDTYMECEATADARRVGRALRRLGVERRIVSHPRAKTGWDSLTDSELTVVNLIAQGATNRDVATQLHLSPHTVKTHVHNAFAKLGITSRAQLAQLMRGAD